MCQAITIRAVHQHSLIQLLSISYIKMKVCVYVRRPAAGPTQPITLKFGVGFSFHPGSAPSQEATPNVDPRGYPL